MRLLLLAIGIIVAPPSVVWSQTNLVINGEFDTDADNWALINHHAANWQSGAGWNASLGYFWLNHVPGSVANTSQAVDGLIPGQTYAVSGYYRTHFQWVGGPSFQVLVDGAVVFQGGQAPVGDWTFFTSEFVANAASVQLKLQGQIGSDSDYDIDNIQMAQVPEVPTIHATVSLSRPSLASGSRIASCAHVDVSPTLELLGSYGATLSWDPTVLQFFSVSGGDSPFDTPTVNADEVAFGSLVVADAAPGGTGGNVFVFCAEFDVIGAAGSSSLLDLDLTSAFSATSFVNLLPAMVTDTTVDVVLECTVGDVNGDGSINSGDALIILSDDIGLPIPALLENGLNAGCGDANGDGVTNATDANIVLAFEVGLSIDPGFPINGTNQTVDACTSCGGGGASPAAYEPTNVSGVTNSATALALDSQVLPRDTRSSRSIPIELRASSSRARQGELLHVSVLVDPGAVHKSLGSYSGRLEWDARALEFVGVIQGSTPGFETPLANLATAGRGMIRFTAANPRGVAGQVELLRAQFRALGNLKDVAARFHKELTSLAASGPAFEDLLPVLVEPRTDRRLRPSRGE